MMESAGLIRRQDLIDEVAKSGLSVTPAQLQRWHQAGIIPRSIPRPLGRGRGVVVYYPIQTVGLVIRVLQLKERLRSLSEIAFQAWCEGYPVPFAPVRQYLLDRGRTLEEGLRTLRKAGSLTTRLLDALSNPRMRRTVSPELRRMHRRLGGSRLSTLLRLLSEMAKGRFMGFEVDPALQTNEEEQIFLQGFELERAQTDALPGQVPWLPPNFGDSAGELSRLVHSFHPEEIAKSVSEARVRGVLGYLGVLRMTIPAVSGVLEGAYGKGAFGFGAIGRILRQSDSPPDVAGWCLILLHLDANSGGQMDPWIKQMSTSAPSLNQFSKLMFIGSKVNALGRLLTKRRLRSALADPSEGVRLESDLRRVMDAYRDEVEAASREYDDGHRPQLS